MLRPFRLPLLSRLLVAGLLVSLGSGLAAPAWAAERARAEWVVRAAAGGAAGEAAVEAALREAALLEASRTSATPAAWAEDVARALARWLPAGSGAPAADALLRELFGHLFSALALERGPQAVLMSASGGAAPSPKAEPLSAGSPVTPAGTAAPVLARPARADLVLASSPRSVRPAVQPLGP